MAGTSTYWCTGRTANRPSFHHGTPGAPVDFGPIVKVAAETGVRVVNYARPGYAESTEHPGRDVAAAAADVIAIADDSA